MTTNQRAGTDPAGRRAAAHAAPAGSAERADPADEPAELVDEPAALLDRPASPVGEPAAPAGGSGARRMAVLSFPADKDYLALARTTAMHVAGLLELPLSRVTDLRLAVDEACASFLTAGRAAAGYGAAGHGAVDDVAADHAAARVDGGTAEWDGSRGALELRYDLYPDRLCVSVRAPVPANWPQIDELGWSMLQALVSEVHTEVAEGIGTLVLVEQLPSAPGASSTASSDTG
jgi:serine/threonine-protein kinase RsbW